MKTSRNFLVILLGLAFTSSFLIQGNADTNQLNHASLISFADEVSPITEPGTKTNTANLENAVLLHAVKDGNTLIAEIDLPEVKIVADYNRDNIYPAVKVDGKYIPQMQLQQVDIIAK